MNWIAFLGTAGVFTFLGTVLGAGIEGFTALKLERQKYEYSLISTILADKEIEKQEAANQLLFLIDIGAVRALDTQNLREQTKQPERLPSFTRRSSQTSTPAPDELIIIPSTANVPAHKEDQ